MGRTNYSVAVMYPTLVQERDEVFTQSYDSYSMLENSARFDANGYFANLSLEF